LRAGPVREQRPGREEQVVRDELDAELGEDSRLAEGRGFGADDGQVAADLGADCAEAVDGRRCFHVSNVETLGAQFSGEVPCRRDEKEQPLLVPGSAGGHACALDEDNQVVGRVGGRQRPAIAVQVIERDIDDSASHARRHFSEQNFTFSQSRAHFLRHSNGRPHRSQFLGGCPFLSLATRGMTPDYAQKLGAHPFE
jgi:hypothetical protein